MKIGIASSVFVNYSIQEAIEVVSNAGYDSIDIWGGRPHVYRSDFSKEELQEIRHKIESLNLEVCSFMPAFFRYPHSLSNPNKRVRQDSIEYMRQCMDNASHLGAKILLVIPGKSLHDQSLEDAWKRNLESIEIICKYSESYDFALGLEPANRFVTDLVNTAADALEVLNQINHEKLGVVMDTGHMNLVEEKPSDSIALLGKNLLQIHVNDNDGIEQLNLIPGDGTFNFSEFIRLLTHSEFSGCISAELGWRYTSNPESPVKLTASRLRDMIPNQQ
jgi:protein FrlC